MGPFLSCTVCNCYTCLLQASYFGSLDLDDSESHDLIIDDVSQPLYNSEPVTVNQVSAPKRKRKSRSKPKDGPQCQVCGKACGNEQALNQHMALHSQDRPFMCRLCGWRFQRHENLIAHSRVHSGERPFKCEHCCRAFTQISAMRRHVKTAHGIANLPPTQAEQNLMKKQGQDKTSEFCNSITEILSNI